MTTIEDKLLQTAITKILTPVYEQLFLPCSYGFRPGKSQHQALESLFKEASFKGMRYVMAIMGIMASHLISGKSDPITRILSVYFRNG